MRRRKRDDDEEKQEGGGGGGGRARWKPKKHFVDEGGEMKDG